MQSTHVIYWLPLSYIILINIVAFLSMWRDKRKSSKNEWRVAEATLLSLGFIGGAIGTLGGMYKFRHKTQKRSFRILAIIGLVVSLLIYWLISMLYV
ncbi:DUF1294 domain-containing protein [Candidatus Thorarchaeota archaeon]|nr:MAG: DUF1294 domain-containing protein [Candidatus Thorarchaeota archaeon]